MARRHHGLTEAIAASYTEAARVCLDRHHDSPIKFEIKNSDQTSETVAEWERTDERTRGAWANETEATEFGACACTIAAVELTNALVAVHRAETRTGADYYVAPVGSEPADLENCVRLEISGVDHGRASAVQQRLREKLEQAANGVSNLPAMAGVVGFKARVIFLARLDVP